MLFFLFFLHNLLHYFVIFPACEDRTKFICIKPLFFQHLYKGFFLFVCRFRLKYLFIGQVAYFVIGLFVMMLKLLCGFDLLKDT